LKTLLEEAGSSPRAIGATLLRLLEKNELLQEQEHEMRAIHNLCRNVDTRRKNMVLLDLVRSSADKVIVFVKYQATLQYLSDFLNWEGSRMPFSTAGLRALRKRITSAGLRAISPADRHRGQRGGAQPSVLPPHD